MKKFAFWASAALSLAACAVENYESNGSQDTPAIDPEHTGEVAQAATVEVTIGCQVNPGGSFSNSVCISPVSNPTSIRYDVTNSTFSVGFRSWSPRNPDGTMARRVSGCRVLDRTCEVQGKRICARGPALADGSSRLTPIASTSYGGRGINPFGEAESGVAFAVQLPGDCEDPALQTADLPPFLPPLVLVCNTTGGPQGFESCFPTTTYDSAIYAWVPQLPPVPSWALRFEWETFGTPILGGCTSTSSYCILHAPPRPYDRTIVVAATAVDTRFETWTTGFASGSFGAVCNGDYC
jgi:hypothetical protein